MPAVDAATSEVLSTWSPVAHGHHLASCDTYITVGIRPPSATRDSHRLRGSTARARPSAFSHYTQSRV